MTTTDSQLEVVCSESRILIANTANAIKNVTVNGVAVTLAAYDVQLLNL